MSRQPTQTANPPGRGGPQALLQSSVPPLPLLPPSAQINSPVSGMHAISSSDDVKPPFGLRPMSAHSPGIMLSQKRLCAICGDRSSGEPRPAHHLPVYIHHQSLSISTLVRRKRNNKWSPGTGRMFIGPTITG